MPAIQPEGALELVIFDCDGVLIDSEPIANRVPKEQAVGAAHADRAALLACGATVFSSMQSLPAMLERA